MNKLQPYDLVIIGAGVSGTFGAYFSHEHLKVCLIDKNKQILKKFMISGKGKANIANTSPTNNFVYNLIGNKKFMYPCLNNFNGKDILSLLDKYHLTYYEKEPSRYHLLSTNIEFRKIFEQALLNKQNLTIKLNTKIKEVNKIDQWFHIKDENGWHIKSKNLIIATGGLSFKNTGCNGFGYEVARHFCHQVNNPYPIGVGLVIKDKFLQSLQGSSLDDVKVSVYEQNKQIYQETGSLMFSHYGLGGPVIRRVSGYVSFGLLNQKSMHITVSYINEQELKNLLDHNNKLNECFSHHHKKVFRTLLNNFDWNLDLKNASKQLKQDIINSLCNVKYEINETDKLDVAINTGGGISLKQLNPNTLESTLVSNLFFIGETIDVNPRTNGYNITCCISMAKKCIDYINNKDVSK